MQETAPLETRDHRIDEAVPVQLNSLFRRCNGRQRRPAFRNFEHAVRDDVRGQASNSHRGPFR
jgi:hypothetical protein